jgi:hypothetical protein
MKLTELTTDDLIANFEQYCLNQYKADLNFNSSHYNRAFDSMMAVSKELRSRPGDQRRALVTLYDHPNEQVRLKAAIHTLALFPEEACQVLQKLIDDRIYPQAGDAGMILDSFKEGRYVPD